MENNDQPVFTGIDEALDFMDKPEEKSDSVATITDKEEEETEQVETDEEEIESEDSEEEQPDDEKESEEGDEDEKEDFLFKIENGDEEIVITFPIGYWSVGKIDKIIPKQENQKEEKFDLDKYKKENKGKGRLISTSFK